MSTPIGIDLGTTYSVVAQVDAHGRAAVLPNTLAETIVPSVVHFESASSVLVGTAANAASILAPERTVRLIKRQMGLDRPFEFFGISHTPESISALILRALVDGVGLTGARAVVTVPAYFGIPEREATQQACLLAGIDVLELVAEPVAAAIHYGLSDSRNGLALVYDLGGGTFDATLLALGDDITTLATDGDVALGGADWDRRLADYLLSQVPGGEEAGPAFLAELDQLAERVKRHLSESMQQRVPLRYNGVPSTVPISRADFEAMTADLVSSTVARVRRLLQASGHNAGEVTDVILVGGSSRMPMISAALRAEFGWQPRLHDPDQAVAKGAALRAHRITAGSSAGSGRRADAASVVPRALGLLFEDSGDPTASRSFVSHVIHANDRLPATVQTELATILPGQRAIKITVCEQAGGVASPAIEHNRAVLEGELTNLPAGLPAGSPLSVKLMLGLDGRLQVTATEPRSGRSLTLEAFVDGVIDTTARLESAARHSAITVRL